MISLPRFLGIEILSQWMKGPICQAKGGQDACEQYSTRFVWQSSQLDTLFPLYCMSIMYHHQELTQNLKKNAETDEQAGKSHSILWFKWMLLDSIHQSFLVWNVQHNDWWLQGVEDERTMWLN